MLIRSQNRKSLVSADNSLIEVDCEDIIAHYGERQIKLGEYRSKEKAMKVFDMIQQQYNNYEYNKIIATGITQVRACSGKDAKIIFDTVNDLHETMIFKMPQDSEVKV